MTEPSFAPSLRDLFEKALLIHAQRPALTVGGRTLTYHDLDVEYAVFDLAVMRCGAAKVPLNERLAPAQVAHAVDHSGATVLVVGSELQEHADRAVSLLEDRPTVLEADTVWTDRSVGLELARAEVGPDDLAAIFYTGGTTGRPKGVVHLQRSLVANQFAHVVEAEIGADERLLLATPLAHAAGSFFQAALVRGAHTFVLPVFDPSEVLRVVQEHRITLTFAVPTMIYRLLDRPELAERDLSSLRTIVYGAAPIAPARLAEALAAFGPVFVQLYGQTECPNWGTRLSKDDHAAGGEILASCGRATLLADVMIVDGAGTELAPGVTGEVCLRAPYTLDHYHDDPRATAEKFVGDWIRTGDLGFRNEHGYVFLKDRASDMIISGGMNVYSTEVEAVVQGCPGVSQAAVVGVPHPDWGEAVHVVVVRADLELEEGDILAFARPRLADYQRPKSVSFIDDMPLTPFGKIDKKVLRSAFWHGQDRAIH